VTLLFIFFTYSCFSGAEAR